MREYLVVVVLACLIILACQALDEIGETSLAPPSMEVNISPLLQGTSSTTQEEVDTVIRQLEAAFRSYGTVLLTGHGISREDREAYLSTAKELLALPLETKLAVQVDPTVAIGRGYLPFAAESGLSDFVEPKEGYSLGHPGNKEVPPLNRMASPNRWPEGFPATSISTLSKLFLQLTNIAGTITDHIIRYRGLTNLVAEGGAEISLLRLFHYFSQSSSLLKQRCHDHPEKCIGSSPHTDWGLLTLILPSTTTGLQFFYNGSWNDVAPSEDALAMNVGDFFSLATQGDYHSPIHRVLVPKEHDRLSLVLFYYPNYNSRLQLLNPQLSCSDESGAEGQNQCASQEATELNYNTLLAKHRLEGEEVVFGDYIIEKWDGVSRTSY